MADDNTEQCLNVLDSLKELDVDVIQQEYIRNAVPEKIGCINLTGDQNVAMIVRTASLFGLSEVAIIGRRPYHRRATVGMHRYIPTNFYRAAQGHQSEEYDIPAILKLLTEFSTTHTIVFVEQSGKKLTAAFEDTTMGKPAFFVMGNEGDGIPDAVLAFKPSICVSIPQRGVGRSHNVANAASMVLWEYFRNKL